MIMVITGGLMVGEDDLLSRCQTSCAVQLNTNMNKNIFNMLPNVSCFYIYI